MKSCYCCGFELPLDLVMKRNTHMLKERIHDLYYNNSVEMLCCWCYDMIEVLIYGKEVCLRPTSHPNEINVCFGAHTITHSAEYIKKVLDLFNKIVFSVPI